MLKIYSNRRSAVAALLFGAAMLLIAGCGSSTPPSAASVEQAKAQPKLESVTFCLPGMNQKLKIL